MKLVTRVGLIAVVFAGLLVSGCVRKAPRRIDPAGLIPPPPPRDFDVNPLPGGDKGWGNVPDGLAPVPGTTVVPITARWADVVVYFAYDSSAIGPAERPKLETLSKHLNEHSNYSVVVEGHCDDRGSDEYNRALGESRAIAVRDYLANLGIEGNRLQTLSYGEERPVLANAKTEQQHQKNRRAEFIIGIRR